MPNADLVARFSETFASRPSDHPRRSVGIELEFPIIRHDGQAVEFNVVTRLFDWLQANGWTLDHDEGTGAVVGARRPSEGQGRYGFTWDVVATDVGYSTIEVSLPPQDDLHRLRAHWGQVRDLLLSFLGPANCHLLGYGAQPLTPPHRGLLAPKSRYRFFEEDSLHRFVDQRYGTDLTVHALTGSSQCHIDVYEDEAITGVNVANGLAPVLTALTANSSVWRGRVDEQWLDVREIFWDWAWSNWLDQIGIPAPFADIADYVDRICRFRPLMVRRSGQFLKILDRATFGDYLAAGADNIGVRVDGQTVPLIASPDDLIFHAGFAWWQARLAPAHGTLEVRPCSQQPGNATLAVAAVSLGLVENLADAEHLYRQFTVTDWQRLRFDALRHGLRATLHDVPVRDLAAALVEIAAAGLRRRGLGEEQFLDVLRHRIASGVTPADEVARVFDPRDLRRFLDVVEIR